MKFKTGVFFVLSFFFLQKMDQIDVPLARQIRENNRDRENTQVTNMGNTKGGITLYPSDVKGQ